jgi:excisionase family DNA binding protein
MLLNVVQAARALGVSVESVRRRIKSGEWPCYRLGPKSTRIDPAEIMRLGRMVTAIEREQKKEQPT